MTIEGALWGFAVPYVVVTAATALLIHVVGPKWVLGLFESEGKPSIRLVLAAVVTVFALFMIAANRISDNKLEALLIFVGTLLGLGTGKIIASRWAKRPVAPATQIKANNAPIKTDNVTLTSPPVE